jgi:hypothetical protein
MSPWRPAPAAARQSPHPAVVPEHRALVGLDKGRDHRAQRITLCGCSPEPPDFPEEGVFARLRDIAFAPAKRSLGLRDCDTTLGHALPGRALQQPQCLIHLTGCFD